MPSSARVFGSVTVHKGNQARILDLVCACWSEFNDD